MGQEQGKILTDDEVRKAEISKMDAEMSRRMGRGANWNLKVLIRGARCTGKSCLFERLQGRSFLEEYVQTPRISTAHINWSYKTSNDIVKVEVWDVVDVAKVAKKTDSLKLSEEVPQADDASTLELDANTVDVMRGTHAVILCYDPRKRWTWEYVETELPKIIACRAHVLVLENFRDVVQSDVSAQDPNRRQVSLDEARQFCELHGSFVTFAQASTKNCFGLKSVKIFLNLPFLNLQKEALEAKLKRNQEETDQTREEFRMVSEEQSYDTYVEWLTHRSKAVPTGLASPSQDSPVSSPVSSAPSTPTPAPADAAPRAQRATSTAQPISKAATKMASDSPTERTKPLTTVEAEREAQAAAAALVEQIRREQGLPAPKKEEKKGFFSSLFSKISGDEENETKSQPTAPPKAKKVVSAEDTLTEIKKLRSPSSGKITSVDDFVPDMDDGDDWLGGSDSITSALKKSTQTREDADDDDDTGNPMVAADVDDVQVSYDIPALRPAPAKIASSPPKQSPPKESVIQQAAPKTTPLSIPVKVKQVPAAPPPSFSPTGAAQQAKAGFGRTPSGSTPPISSSVPEVSTSPKTPSMSPPTSNTLAGMSFGSIPDEDFFGTDSSLDSFLDSDAAPSAVVTKPDSDDDDGSTFLLQDEAPDSEPAPIHVAPTTSSRRTRGSRPPAPVVVQPAVPAAAANRGKKRAPEDSELMKAVAASLAADWDDVLSHMPAQSKSPPRQPDVTHTSSSPSGKTSDDWFGADSKTKPASKPTGNDYESL